MGESSKWIPEVKKTHFWPFGIFFPKIKVKSGKNEKLAKIGEKGSKMDFFGFPTLFATIFITRAHQTGQKSHFQHFWQFLVIFDVLPSSSKKANVDESLI